MDKNEIERRALRLVVAAGEMFERSNAPAASIVAFGRARAEACLPSESVGVAIERLRRLVSACEGYHLWSSRGQVGVLREYNAAMEEAKIALKEMDDNK